MFFLVRYTTKAPDSVKGIPHIFRHKIEKIGHSIKLIEANDRYSDEAITLVFFPIVSRTGTDIDASVRDITALSYFLDNKPAILVVLHHTFDPECIVSDSSKFVERENTLVVDCLFFEDKGLLECKRNEKAYDDAVKWLKSQVCLHFISIT
ncbi:hypothetical protein PO909_025819 [Leuciscus waleckii]